MSGRREAFPIVVAAIPIILTRLVRSLFGMAFQSRRSATRFRKALAGTGLEPELARRLASHYREQVSLTSLIRTALRSGK